MNIHTWRVKKLSGMIRRYYYTILVCYEWVLTVNLVLWPDR